METLHAFWILLIINGCQWVPSQSATNSPSRAPILKEETFLDLQRSRRDVGQAPTSTENSTLGNLTENESFNLTNYGSNLGNKSSSELAEELPTPEAYIGGRRSKDPISGKRSRYPYQYSDSRSKWKSYSNKRRNSGSSRIRDGDYVYMLPNVENIYEDEDPSWTDKSSRSKSSSSYLRRRPRPNRDRLPPDEDVYSLYSAGRPYRKRSRTYDRGDKDIPIITSLINTGTGILKMLNPFTYFGNSEEDTPPPRPVRYREIRPPRYYRKKPSTYEDFPEKGEDSFLGRPYDEEESTPPEDSPYESYRYGDDSHPSANSRYRSKYSSSDFVHDDELLSDDDYSYDNYDFDKSGKYKSKNKMRTPKPPRDYDPRGSYRDDWGTFKDRPDYDYDDGTYRKKSKYSSDGLQYVDDTHTLDYLKEIPLRNDLYIAKDGNIYLKGDKESKGDLYGLDMYGMEYPETAMDSKYYANSMSESKKNVVYVKPNRGKERATGREFSGRNSDLLVDGGKRVTSGSVAKRESQDRNPTNSHSNFAMRKLSLPSTS